MSPNMMQSSSRVEQSTLEPVAICGMSCRLPGGVDSASLFWQMLVEKRTGQTPKVPASRFNIDAHYHQDRDRPGSFDVAGGYFLDGKADDFDPGFFNITPIEAQWLDPQQRRMLEVSYECLESAGLTLDQVAGSNTAVFVGSFTADYQQLSTREPDFRHSYAATGVDPGIISNRVGHIFNLNGPSFTINSACSSSIYALHNACNALRARDCEAAIVGGVNLILTVDQHMNTAKLGILSPTSTCHTFDAAADGYGRAEGAGALYLKRLSDAIRDGDPIRGVIRASAVNTNGKIEGTGITHPSGKGQERVVRMAYEKAGLNPAFTAYAELHGTGTPVGDPIEVQAISRALNDERPEKQPLFVGAVKPNIGHSEAASGIFAVMKAALMTEAAVIPGVALFNRLNPEILEDKWNVKVHADTAPWPKEWQTRRTSVSSFGYGGTNGHVIIESVDNLHPFYQHAKRKREANYDHTSKRPFLLCFSAHDNSTLHRNIQAIGAVAADYFTADLAHTLNLHRTKLSHRAFTIAYEGQENKAFVRDALRTRVLPKKNGSVGFLFTGQGAQWIGMGKVALREFPVFADTIEKVDRILSKLTPKPTFTITDMLRGTSQASRSRIDDAEVAQTLCTAIQIALVDLFFQWNITPSVSIGHSSGEIGAAYAAGLISAPEAIIAAYCRGCAVQKASGPGSMLAVGLGAQEVKQWLSPDPDEICIACENSPGSVTLSGNAKTISQLGRDMKTAGVFAQELNTGRAYHSPHMLPVGDVYNAMLPQDLAILTEDDLAWRRPRSPMISSVTGEHLTGDTITPDYWSTNLREKVRFDAAVQRMGLERNYDETTSIIEVGCHSALSRSFRQIGLTNKTYIPSLVRDKDDADQLLSVAGSLFLAGYPVDLEEVNLDLTHETSPVRRSKTQYLLVDLPGYQWNYEKRYWAEPRTSMELRSRSHPRHDLLGTRIAGLSNSTKVWRNVLRHRDVPWLKDHDLGGEAMFPAAGYMSVAIEALRQVHELEGRSFTGVLLRDINLKTALIVPESDGIEVVTCLSTGDGLDHTFTLESFDDGQWVLHCEGRITAREEKPITRSQPVKESALTQRASGKRWYNAFHRVNFNYMNTFQRLLNARTNRSLHHAAGDIVVSRQSGIMQGESRYMIHPSTIDACLQLVIISIHAGKHKEMPWGVVPTRIEKVSMVLPKEDATFTGHAVAWMDNAEDRHFNTHTCLADTEGEYLMDIENLTCISYEAILPAHAQGDTKPQPYSMTTWKPDIAALAVDSGLPLENVGQVIELICHRQSVESAIIVGSPSSDTVEFFLDALPQQCTLTLGYSGEQEVDLPDSVLSRIVLKTLSISSEDWLGDLDHKPRDLVLVDFSGTEPPKTHIGRAALMPLVNSGGWLVDFQNKTTPLQSSLKPGQYFASMKTETTPALTNGVHFDNLTVLSPAMATSTGKTLADVLSSGDKIVRRKDLSNFSADEDHHVVIDDTAGTFLLSLPETEFTTLKSIIAAGVRILWLTRGTKEGRSAEGGMAEGFLRVIRSEQVSARIVLLDVSQDEKPEHIAQAVISKLESAATKDSGHDTEFWLHNGILYIPRLHPRTVLYEEPSEEDWPPELSVDTQPSGASLNGHYQQGVSVPKSGFSHSGLSETEVEVQIEASELLPTLESDTVAMGPIIRAGPSLEGSVVGKHALVIAHGGTQATVKTSAYILVDEDLSSASSKGLLTILVSLQPLVYAHHLSNKMGERVRFLALPGPNSSMTMLAILSRALNFDLTIVVHSVKEREAFKMRFSLNDEHVLLADDLKALVTSMERKSQLSSLSVIAHDFSSLAQDIWKNIPASSQFLLLMNEPSMRAAPDHQPFMRGASFVPVNTSALHLRAAADLLEQSLALLKTHKELLAACSEIADPSALLKPTNYANAAENNKATSVSRRSSHGHTQTQNHARQPLSHSELRFKSDATYLLVGCLGGLGRSLTTWMMERGARHFAFISRSGADKPEAARVVAEIEKVAAASAKVYRADAADEDAVQEIVSVLQAERPIRGVVHAAMVLKDRMFEQQSHESFHAAITPKVRGALSLHRALGPADLDFFVMTSSVSAVLGNTGQSNYSAANSFLDALARVRTTSGLAAASLALPMVLDVGVVAEDDAIETSLVRKGLYGISEDEMLRGFEVAMRNSRLPCEEDSRSKAKYTGLAIEMHSHLIMGMDPRELGRSIRSTTAESLNLCWINDARLTHIKASIYVSHNSDSSAASPPSKLRDFASTIEAAQAAGAEAVVDAIAYHIAGRMSAILMIPVADFELDGPSLGSYGLDSMVGAEMRSWLFKEFSLDIPFQKLLARTVTFRALGRLVAEKMGLLEGNEG